jgi:hypothetical protein
MLGKNIFPKVLIFILVILLSTGIVFASSLNRALGGKIISTEGKANEILAAEAAGFVCPVVGTTFNIMPVKSGIPVGIYLIPPGIIGRGGGIPMIRRWILGLYTPTPTVITCVQAETGATITLNAYPITLYGTSYR